MIWDEWIGSIDGRPTMYVKHLCCFFGCHIDLHKMVKGDDPGCFHTHPAYAVRIILRGGYLEQMEDGTFQAWTPRMVGIVAPSLCHRIAMLKEEASYSLWIRFRKIAKIELRGHGWQRQREKVVMPLKKGNG